MIGSWRWNLMFAGLGALLTIVFSFTSNILTTVLLRSLYAFITFFVAAYPFRFILSLVTKPSSHTTEAATLSSQDAASEITGMNVDVATPEQSDELNQLLKSSLQEKEVSEVQHDEGAGFKPLSPPQFVSAKPNTESEELAKAIRHLTEE